MKMVYLSIKVKIHVYNGMHTLNSLKGGSYLLRLILMIIGG